MQLLKISLFDNSWASDVWKQIVAQNWTKKFFANILAMFTAFNWKYILLRGKMKCSTSGRDTFHSRNKRLGYKLPRNATDSHNFSLWFKNTGVRWLLLHILSNQF